MTAGLLKAVSGQSRQLHKDHVSSPSVPPRPAPRPAREYGRVSAAASSVTLVSFSPAWSQQVEEKLTTQGP